MNERDIFIQAIRLRKAEKREGVVAQSVYDNTATGSGRLGQPRSNEKSFRLKRTQRSSGERIPPRPSPTLCPL